METKQTQTAEELQAQLLRKMHSMDLIRTAACVLVRVVIQNFLKKPVISTVFKADE